MTQFRPHYLQFRKCPAIIFNNSGSMLKSGRVDAAMDIIRETFDTGYGVDYYVNDTRTGIPDFVTHIEDNYYGISFTAPLIPMVNGDDYINTLALAAVISEYPEGVHIIDDGDGIGKDISEALHLLKSMKSPGYMHPVTLHYIRGPEEVRRVEQFFEHCMSLVPEDEGFRVKFHYRQDS